MVTFHDTLRSLLDSVPSRRLNALHTLEQEGDEAAKKHFCIQAAGLPPSLGIELCGALQHTTDPLFIDLLGNYAESGEAMLCERAMKALGHIPPDLRLSCLTSLLKAKSSAVRRESCVLLGASSNQSPRNSLVATLKDSSVEVVLAALEALRLLSCRDAVPEVEELLEHPQFTLVDMAIRVLVDLAAGSKFREERVVRLLRDHPALEVKMTCCWAFGKRPSPAARDVLLEVIDGDGPVKIRTAAAVPLASYPDPVVMRSLLVAGARARLPELALQCRRALNGMPEKALLAVSSSLLAESDAEIRMMVTGLIGQLSFPGAEAILVEQLLVETDPLQRATLVEALGHGGWQQHWALIRRCTGEEPLVAYSAVNALADLLDDSHLIDFAGLLEELALDTLHEALLKRLVTYGSAKNLPATLAPLLLPKLKSGVSNIQVLTAQALGYVVKDPSLPGRLLEEIILHKEEGALREALCESAGHLCMHSLGALCTASGGGLYESLMAVLLHQGRLGKDPESFFLPLAAALRSGAPFAEECLRAAASVDPLALAHAVPLCGAEEQPVLIQAWMQIPLSQRRESLLDFERLLESTRDEVRLLAIAGIPLSAPMPLFRNLVELAQLDPSALVRRSARQKVRSLIEEAGE